MVLDEQTKPVDLRSVHPAAAGHSHRIEPEFGGLFPGADVDVGWLAGRTFITVEENPVSVRPENRRHYPAFLEFWRIFGPSPGQG